MKNKKNKGLDESITSESPDSMNRKELQEYYGFKGFFGNVRMNFMFFKSWFYQNLAARVPIYNWAVQFQRLRGVKIGKHVFIGPNVMLDLMYPQLITLEDYVSVGMNSSFFVHGNPTNCVWIKTKIYPRYIKPIIIGKGTWIAPNCTFLPGISIGHHSVVGAGSVVTKSFEPFSVIAGNPAKLIKKIKPNDEN